MDLEQTAIERLRMASEMSLRLYNRQNQLLLGGKR
jgi:hypothetical protein|nr:MAG TPA: hypothetical protein [Caudoviricetes sp.]